jgi:sigma-B regulation protein RsbU (phosphoserine phosphatase)
MIKITLKISKPVRYSFYILIAAAGLFLAVRGWQIYSKHKWKIHTRELAESRLKGEVDKIQKTMKSIEQIPLNLAYVLEFASPKKEHMDILMESVVKYNDEIFGTGIAFEPNLFNKDSVFYCPYIYKKDGKIVRVNPSDTTYYYFSMDWYLIPKQLQKPVWIEPYYDEGSSGGNIVLSTYSVPFYSYDGTTETFNGIVAVDISLDWLSKMVSSIKLSDDSYTVLVSENGTVISAPNQQWPYNESIFSIAEEKNEPYLREIGRDLQKGKSGFVNVGKFGTEKNWWIYYMPIPANNWGVLLIVPEE